LRPFDLSRKYAWKPSETGGDVQLFNLGTRVFGWSKLDHPLRQVKLRGLDRVDWFYRLTVVAHNLVRLRRLIPIESLAH
jgi:hypothetical protein